MKLQPTKVPLLPSQSPLHRCFIWCPLTSQLQPIHLGSPVQTSREVKASQQGVAATSGAGALARVEELKGSQESTEAPIQTGTKHCMVP